MGRRGDDLEIMRTDLNRDPVRRHHRRPPASTGQRRGAYVLADEPAKADGDTVAAFAAYERAMRPYVAKNLAFGRKMAKDMVPGSRLMIAGRDYAVRTLRFHPRPPMHEASNAVVI